MIERIYYYPDSSDFNRYVVVELGILRRICADIASVRPLALFGKRSARKNTIAILNWYEDQMGWYRTKPNWILLKSVLVLLVLKLRCKKIIWVRHNFWPLDLPKPYFRQMLLLRCMQWLTTTTVTHRHVSSIKAVVVPHPLYSETDFPESLRDIDFLYFGVIKAYKGLDALLATWPSDRRLIIAGAVRDGELFGRLLDLVKSRGLNVEFIGRFLADDELDALLMRTKFVVLPHKDDAMIVTGAFYHAVSMGANIVARAGEFGRALEQQYDFVTTFDESNIAAVLSDLPYVEARTVIATVRATNGSERCTDAWKQVIGN